VIILPRWLYYGAWMLVAIFVGLIGYIGYLLVNSSNQTRLAVLTAAVSVATLVYAQTQNTKREVAGRLFEKKAEAYEQIMVAMSDAVERGGFYDADQLSKEALSKLLIWADPGVLFKWQWASGRHEDRIKLEDNVNELIIAVRRDLGHAKDLNNTQFGNMLLSRARESPGQG
jgi:hypothetical protein